MMKHTAPDFSRMVRRIRQALFLSQAQFAQLFGVTPAAVSLWESRDRQPEGPALRLLYALDEKIQQKPPSKSQVEEIVKAIAIGAAFAGFLALLATVFSSQEK